MTAISRALDHGLRILEFLADQTEPQSLSDICRQLELPKSSTHRLLATLDQRGYVNRDGSLKYGFGPKLLELVGAYDPWLRLRRAASPVMNDLAQRSGETCHLAVLFRGHAVYVDKVNSPRSISMASRIGSTAALHASSVGKALLSGLAPAELDAFIAQHGLPRLTAKTITCPDELREHLTEVRVRGYAVDDEEEEEGVKCVGAPLFDHHGQVVAALSLAALSFDLPQDRIPELARMVRDAAAKVSYQLGYAPQNLPGIGSGPFVKDDTSLAQGCGQIR
jgi:IclR family acetate operon transcriptional repressor